MKWVVLVVVVILAAPTLAKRFTDPAEQRPRRNPLYRALRRHGPARVGLVALIFLVAVVAAIVVITERL